MIDGDVTNDGFSTKVTTARGFSVEYFNTYKVVNNSLAGEVYVLTQCGATPPPASEYPDAKFFSIPLYSVSVAETVPFAFMDILGVSGRAFDVSEYVVAPCGQRLADVCGRVAPQNVSNVTALTNEIGGVTDGLVTSSENAFPTAFSFNAATDPSVLGRAEWVKFLGLFFNLDSYSSAVYTAIENEYDALRREAAAATARHKPVVAWVQHYVYMDDESYLVSFAPYKSQLVTDAGGAVLDSDEIASIPGVQPTFSGNLEFGWAGNGTFDSRADALDALWDVLADVDVLIDETYAPVPLTYNLTSFLEEYAIHADAAANNETAPAAQRWFANGAIYRVDGLLSETMGLDWYEGALARPAPALRDVYDALTAAAPAEKPFVWIRNIAQTPRVVTPADCPAPPGSNACTAAPPVICPFVSFCADGTPVPLKAGITPTDTNSVNGKCTYEPCA